MLRLPPTSYDRTSIPQQKGIAMAPAATNDKETTHVLAQFAAALRYDDLPPKAREHCKHLLLDALACALAGDRGEETPQMTAVAAAIAQSHESSIIGGEKLNANLRPGFDSVGASARPAFR